MKRLIIAILLGAVSVCAAPPEPRLNLIRRDFGLPQQGVPPGAYQAGGGAGISFVAAVAATCTPGVTPPVELSVSAYTINYCSATNTWTALTSGGGLSGLTLNCIPKAATATTITGCSSGIDNGTTFALTEPLTTTGSVSTGSGATPCGATATGGICMTQAAATGFTPTAGFSYIRASTTNALLVSINGGAEVPNASFSATPTGSNCVQSSGTLGLIAEVTGACVAVGQTNVYTAGLQDFTAATMEIPEAAGFTTNVNSTIGQDTTANAPHIWANSADALIASEAAGIVANTVTKSTDATHGLITASSMIDNGTNVTSTDTGGYIAPVFVSNGSTAGFIDFPQGTTSAAVAPCNVATSICEQAPTAVTSYLITKPGAAPTVNNSYAATTTAGVQSWVYAVPNVASTTAVTSSNPTINTDQNLIQLSLPATYLNSLTQTFTIIGSGIYSSTAASTPALTFKIKLCTVSGCGSGTVVALANIVTTALNTTAITNATYNIVMTCVTNATGATGNLMCHGSPGLTLDTGALVSSPDTLFADTNTAVLSNIDLTAALFVQFTIAQSVVGGSNSYTQQLASIR
jgi:hypothetical protein